MLRFRFSLLLVLVAVVAELPFVSGVFAQDAVCAKVKIRIEQELTFEREGFEARLGIDNESPEDLTGLTVTLKFTDEKGDPVLATTNSAETSSSYKFFYRPQTGYPSGSPSINVGNGESVDLAYLIVPAPGSALDSTGAEVAAGRLYFVGATVTYTVLGQSREVVIAPDNITVRPMPTLRLQYFLPGDIYGDDPATTPVETVPFPLGVRVLNHSGAATARKLKIQSSQPKIVENEHGLLVNFRILSSEVNGSASAPTLLANLGDIAPHSSAMGSWAMTASLSGRFTEMSAEVSHAPEFGGALTSLVHATETYRLVGRVHTDLPGHDDGIRDFLSTGDDDFANATFPYVLLHESSNSVGYAEDKNALRFPVSAPASASSAELALNVVTSDMVFVRAPSPIQADKVVSASRSDGKALREGNAWISKVKNESNGTWSYTLNLFDTFGPGAPRVGVKYNLTFADPVTENRPPALEVTPSSSVVAVGAPVSAQISTMDPDGTIPFVSIVGYQPEGAALSDGVWDEAAGVWRHSFNWTPTELGDYIVQFKSSDTVGAATSKLLRVTVASTVALGYDGWAAEKWPGIVNTFVVGPDADPDKDEIPNLLEYALGGDPTIADETILPLISLVAHEEQQYLTLSYRRRDDDAALQYTVVASSNALAPLSSWNEITNPSLISEGAQDPVSKLVPVTVRDASPATMPRRYLRLRVTRQTE